MTALLSVKIMEPHFSL